MLHSLVEDAFDDLLTSWREHERRRETPGATSVYLAESRIRLDKARERVHRFRLVMYPDPVELESVAATAFCQTLDAVVHLNWSHRTGAAPGQLTCPCGAPVTVNP